MSKKQKKKNDKITSGVAQRSVRDSSRPSHSTHRNVSLAQMFDVTQDYRVPPSACGTTVTLAMITNRESVMGPESQKSDLTTPIELPLAHPSFSNHIDNGDDSDILHPLPNTLLPHD